MKKICSAYSAIESLKDDSTLLIGGFLQAPETLIDAIIDKKLKGLTIVCNDTNYENQGIGKLIRNNVVKKVITSHIGTNPETQRKLAIGDLEVELVPQGTLVERVRAGGYGLGGILTPTGIGTEAAKGKQIIEVNGKEFLLEKPIRADAALIQASQADSFGNLFHRKTTRNWNPIMAMAADFVIAEVEDFLEFGEINPEMVHTPGIVIDVLVRKEGVKVQ